jgi:hypothetical protein
MVAQDTTTNLSDATTNLIRRADSGDASAQYQLGVMYDNGIGVPKNEAEAMRWWRRAADQGNKDAQSHVEPAQKGTHNASRTLVPEQASVAAEQAHIARVQRDAAEEDNKRLRARRKAAIANLGLHLGQSQATVKSILQRDGFRMPWTCSGYWWYGTWCSGCIAYRGSNIVGVKFSVYSRDRYVNPDTQVSSIVDITSDKLTLVLYGEEADAWGKDGEGMSRRSMLEFILGP